MPPRIDLNKCNGCGGKPETACEMVCPGDLMMLDPETGKARCRATGECWDCMSCIKVCPTGAKNMNTPAYRTFASAFSLKLRERRDNLYLL